MHLENQVPIDPRRWLPATARTVSTKAARSRSSSPDTLMWTVPWPAHGSIHAPVRRAARGRYRRHPSAQPGCEARHGFGRGEDPVGAQLADLRMGPAHERLDPRERAVAAHDRLVDEGEQILVERVAQVVAEGQFGGVTVGNRTRGGGDHHASSWIVVRVAGARRVTAGRSLVLARVHGQVGRRGARRSASSTGRSARATPTLTVTGSCRSPMSTGGVLDAGVHPLADRPALVAVEQVFAHHHELVPAGPAHRVRGPHRGDDAGGHLHEQTIAAVVAVLIVDLLEPVEVAEQDRHGPAGPAGTRRRPARGGRAGRRGCRRR